MSLFGRFGTAAGARGAACEVRNFKKMAQGQPWNWSESENVLKNTSAPTSSTMTSAPRRFPGRCDCFKSRRLLEAEVLVLRHQLNVLQQRAPHRLCLTWIDRALFVWLYRGYPRILDAITILRPETIVRRHRKGFAAFWRWKSRCVYRKPHPIRLSSLDHAGLPGEG